ncbi:MAG: pitrilysin family protein [Longimicrobiales bacterium]|nr:pitrilysin family protein [Longimicrobiales bacterium]
MSVDRTAPPAPGLLRAFEFPPSTRARLASGVDLEVVHLPRLPLVTALLVMRAGEDRLAPDRGGLAVLAGDALEGGTEALSGHAFAEALEAIGADLDVTTGWDATTIALSCLADRLPRALELLASLVRIPAFPEEEVARVRDGQLARIRQNEMDPARLAESWAARTLYAAGEPYARAALGDADEVAGFGREAVAGFAAAFHRPAGAALVVAGDVDPGEVAALADRAMEGWSGGAGVSASPCGAAAASERRTVVVDRPGAVQSEIRIGHTGAPRATPDRAELVVGNAVLGGTFSSRLNLNLRERNGFTYGVRARWGWRRGPGPFLVGTAVDTGVTAAAIEEIVSEIEQIHSEGPREEEIEQARDYLAGVFPLRLESTGQVAAHVAQQHLHGLPRDEWSGYRDRVRAVTAQAAHAALRRWIRPEALQFVVVGDADHLAEALALRDLGSIEVVRG